MVIGIKHGFSCINIRQVPYELLKTEAEGRGFQHIPGIRRMLMHWKTMFYYCIKTENICYISRYFLHYFVSPFHRCLANAISMNYARSRAVQYTSHNSAWIALLIHGFSPVNAWMLITCGTAFYAIIGVTKPEWINTLKSSQKVYVRSVRLKGWE